MVHLSWTHFKPEFLGKPDEDAKAHLLYNKDWMKVYHLVDNIKVQRFCLTLLAEARLWFESLQADNLDWSELQNLFRQQYSKIGNTNEQLFHVWRSFHFDENMETVDAYLMCIRQVAVLLGYGETQILEVFKKHTPPPKLYWILFPIENLRQVVETAKRILTKEKIDKQLSQHSSSTPFMSIKDGYSKRVTFDTRDGLEDKINRLTMMMGKLAARDNGSKRQFKPQVYQSRRRGQYRENYDRQDYQGRYRSDSVERWNQYIAQTLGVGTDMTTIIEVEALEVM